MWYYGNRAFQARGSGSHSASKTAFCRSPFLSLSQDHIPTVLLLLLLRRLGSLILQLLNRLLRVVLIAAVGLDLCCTLALANNLQCNGLARLHMATPRPIDRFKLTALSLSLARPSCHFPLPSFCSFSCCCLSCSASSGVRESVSRLRLVRVQAQSTTSFRASTSSRNFRHTQLALLANGARYAGAESPGRANGARHRCAKGERADADGRHFVWRDGNMRCRCSRGKRACK